MEDPDNPKLVGVVLKEASEFERVNYYDQYFAAQKGRKNIRREKDKPEVVA